MATYYDVIYPPSGTILLDGGLNNKFEKAIISDNESSDVLNCIFSNGAAETRKGSSKLNSNTVGTFVFDGLYTRRDDEGAETMVAFAGGSMRAWNGTTFSTISSAQSVFTAGQRVGTAQYQNNMFIGNGGIIPMKWNGSDFTRHGVYPATMSASFVSVNTTGTMASGSYNYKFSYVNSYSVEGDVGSASTTYIASGSATIRITDIPVAPQSFGVNSRRVYRSDAGASYKLITTISDNTTTTFDDGVGITPGATAPTDSGVPPRFKICLYHQNRLFCDDIDNPNYVWYSNLGEPFTFASTNFFKVGDASSDLVKGLEIYDNSIVVLCETSQWINYMPSTSASDWEQVKVRSSYGTKSPFGSFNYDNKVCFPATQNSKFVGFAAISGNTIEPSATLLTVSSAGSDLLSDRIEPDIFDVQESYIGKISSMVYKNKAYIAVTYGSGATTNNRIYLFDFSISNLSKKQKFSWCPWSGLNPAQFTIYDGKIYYASSTTDGFVYQLETTTYNDNSSAINSYIYTKEFSGRAGQENLIKDFRKIRILCDLAGAFYMKITWKVDSDKGVGQTKNVSLDPGSSLWNTLTWGSGTWGGGQNQYEFEVSLGQTFGKRIQFKFDNQNTADQRFKVHRISFTYNIRGTT